jgi:MtN3 and saliva related transmembrane protein
MEWIGIIGLVCIAGAWVPQTTETIRTKRCTIGIPFLILYILGSLSLTIYALIIGDTVFLLLNIAATVQSVINFYFRLFPGK